MPRKSTFYAGLSLCIALGLGVLVILSVSAVVEPPPFDMAAPRTPAARARPEEPRAPAPARPLRSPGIERKAHQASLPDVARPDAAPSGTYPRTRPEALEAKIYGSVTNTRNLPVEVAEVVLSSPLGSLTVKTDIHGHFRFPPLPPGTFMLRAFHRDYAPHVEGAVGKCIQLAPGELRHVSLNLDPGIRLEGVVVARDNTGPVAGAVLTMIRQEYDRFITTRTRLDGSFRFDHFPALPDGERPFVLEVAAEGFAPEYRTLEPRNGEPRDRLEIRLDRGARILGRVTDSGGAPLTGVKIRCLFKNGFVKNYTHFPGVTDNLGQYQVTHLPRGLPIQVWAHKKGHRSTYLNLILSDHQNTKTMRVIRLRREKG